MARRFAWADWPDERLLGLRLKDLKVQVEGTWLEGCLHLLHEELAQRDLRLRPHAWISDEWFSPDTTPGIAMPFFLAHPRLMRLERRMILDVEGGTQTECMRIMRHEAGHVVQHAFGLHRRRRWQALFGPSSTRYPSYYRPNPASRDHVQNLRLWYGQSHPDEDFAETFAVWLRPRFDWRKRYAGWPALKKLEYVDELMAELAGRRPNPMPRLRVEPLSRMDRTLAEYYERKKAIYSAGFPTVHDRELCRIFATAEAAPRAPTAAAFLRRNRARIRRSISKWTGEYQLALDALFDEMIGRCRELRLRAVDVERRLLMDFTVLLTAKTMHYLYSRERREWYAL